MLEFLEASLLNINLPYTILMLVVLIYWVSVILGVLDFDFLDFDVDVDMDLDVDVDADIDIDAGGGFGFSQALYFFNIGSLPFMIILSFLAFFMWSASVLTNHYIGNSSWLIALGLFIPISIGSLFLTKFATIPFVKMFAAMEQETDIEVIGKECVLMESADSIHIAHGKVVTESGLVQMINVQTIEEGKVISKGTTVIIVEYDEKKKCYLVTEGVRND
ncbi:MAG: hypothetical protein ACI85I_002867 [Arenicella sp.]|jgi:hypothetical protein